MTRKVVPSIKHTVDKQLIVPRRMGNLANADKWKIAFVILVTSLFGQALKSGPKNLDLKISNQTFSIQTNAILVGFSSNVF